MLIKLPFDTHFAKYYPESMLEFGVHVHFGGSTYNHDMFDVMGYNIVGSGWHYGVADNVRQVIDANKFVLNENEFYILLTRAVFPGEESETGGWRWHKNGTYIGDYDHIYEYVYSDYDRGGLKEHLISLHGNDTDHHYLLQYKIFQLSNSEDFCSVSDDPYLFSAKLHNPYPEYFDKPFWTIKGLSEEYEHLGVTFDNDQGNQVFDIVNKGDGVYDEENDIYYLKRLYYTEDKINGQS